MRRSNVVSGMPLPPSGLGSLLMPFGYFYAEEGMSPVGVMPPLQYVSPLPYASPAPLPVISPMPAPLVPVGISSPVSGGKVTASPVARTGPISGDVPLPGSGGVAYPNPGSFPVGGTGGSGGSGGGGSGGGGQVSEPGGFPFGVDPRIPVDEGKGGLGLLLALAGLLTLGG